MSIVLKDRVVLPATGPCELDLHTSAQINVSARAAQRKASGFVLSDVSYLMHGSEPSLVVTDDGDGRVVWRVPIVLSFPTHGDVGIVGSIDIDVETGRVLVTPQRIAEIEQKARTIAARTSP